MKVPKFKVYKLTRESSDWDLANVLHELIRYAKPKFSVHISVALWESRVTVRISNYFIDYKREIRDWHKDLRELARLLKGFCELLGLSIVEDSRGCDDWDKKLGHWYEPDKKVVVISADMGVDTGFYGASTQEVTRVLVVIPQEGG